MNIERLNHMNLSKIIFLFKHSIRIIITKWRLYIYSEKKDYSNYINRQNKKIYKYACKHVPYYKTGAFDTNQLPLISKDIIRSSPKHFMSDRLNSTIYWKANTGGSTGSPFEFLISPQSDSLHQDWFFRKMGFKHGDKILQISGVTIGDSDLKQHIYWKKNRKKAYWDLSCLYLNSNTIPFFVQYIKDLKPAFIRTYPSAILEIAQYMEEKGIQLDYELKGIQLTSESWLEEQIPLLQEIFHTRIWGQYGHTEACVFGYTSANSSTYYCSPFYGKVEVINDREQPVSVGETGEIVVTSFWNLAEPFLRYRTGDIAEWGGEHNGIAKLLKIEGRTQDYLISPDGKVLLTALVFGQHYNAFKNINRWQIVQDEMGAATMHIVKGLGFSLENETEIITKFKNIANINLKIEYVNELFKTNAGKTRFLIQNIK